MRTSNSQSEVKADRAIDIRHLSPLAHSCLPHRNSLDTVSKLGIWTIVSGVIGFIWLIVLNAFYPSFGDVCDATYVSANTPIGWMIAVMSILSVIGFARWLRSRAVMITALCCVPPIWLLWEFVAFHPGGTC